MLFHYLTSSHIQNMYQLYYLFRSYTIPHTKITPKVSPEHLHSPYTTLNIFCLICILHSVLSTFSILRELTYYIFSLIILYSNIIKSFSFPCDLESTESTFMARNFPFSFLNTTISLLYILLVWLLKSNSIISLYVGKSFLPAMYPISPYA